MVDSATLSIKDSSLLRLVGYLIADPISEVVVHPQSIVHSMIRYIDGSVLAQLGQPDMRTPIAYSLSWPDRIDAGVTALDMVSAGRLDFEAPDLMPFLVYGSLMSRLKWLAGCVSSAPPMRSPWTPSSTRASGLSILIE